MILENLIKENPTLNLTVKANELMAFGESIADKTANVILANKEDKIFSRKQVIEKFGICSTTLWRWEKYNLIEKVKVGNRIFFTESEIKRVLTSKDGEK